MNLFKSVRIAFALSFLSVLLVAVYTAQSFWWLLIPVVSYLIVLVAGTVNIGLQFFMPSRIHGSRREQKVALTFDDGPDKYTADVADCLVRHGVTGSFFVIGHKVERHAEVMQQLHQQGHVVGNHGFHHRWNDSLRLVSTIRGEMKQTSEAIEQAIGKKPRFYRPPFGITNPRVAKAVEEEGFVPIGWDVRSYDTVLGISDRLSDRLKRKVRNGSIILLHDTGEGMVGFLDAFIPWMKEQGYQIVSLEKLINEKAYR